MPYVTIQALSRDKLLESAQRRWQVVRDTRPDLAPALTLQHDLLTRVIDLSDPTSRLPGSASRAAESARAPDRDACRGRPATAAARIRAICRGKGPESSHTAWAARQYTNRDHWYNE